MHVIPIEVLKQTSNLVKIKLSSSGRILDVPKRVFQKRVDVGVYEVKNQAELPTII